MEAVNISADEFLRLLAGRKRMATGRNKMVLSDIVAGRNGGGCRPQGNLQWFISSC